MKKYTIRLRELREAKGWTQREFSDISGVRQATISQYENNNVKSVNLRIIATLADTLGVSIEDILDEEDFKVEAA